MTKLPEKTDNSFLQKLAGQVEKVTFYNPDSGFCIIKLKTLGKKGLISVLGVLPNVGIGEKIAAVGYFENSSAYGQTFKAQSIVATHPTSTKGIEKYLASGLIKGVGPAFAKKLVQKFGSQVFTVIEQEPEKLRQIEGFTAAKLESITQNWLEQKTIREIALFFHSYNINVSRAVKIYNIYGAASIKTIENNPYLLSQDIKGFGFKEADVIAENLGIEKNSLIRAKAGLNYALTKAMDDGHCGIPSSQLIYSTQKLLAIPTELISEALFLELRNGELIKYSLNFGLPSECIFLKNLAQAELFIAEKLVKISRAKQIWPKFTNTGALIAKEAISIGIELSFTQKAAIEKALHLPALVITGGPGVGKTTILNIIVKILERKGVKILLSAPTGRAAKKMAEVTGLPATTIHRLLKKNIDDDWDEHIRLKCDLLIVDEMSMVDAPLMAAVLKAMPEKAAIFLFGDIDQLPSIGPGKVLEDIINSNSMPVIKLTEIFRQSQQSQIITNAHKINAGQVPDLINNKDSDFFFIEAKAEEHALELIVDLVKRRLPKKFELSPSKDIQVICPMNKGIVGTINLNDHLQKALTKQNLPKSKCTNLHGIDFYLNDKVMQTINNYELEVFNGDIGIITHIDNNERLITVNYDGRLVNYEYKCLDELTLAYAITVHKSQGSEYPVVVIPLFAQHYPMLQRNLLYTAISRGKKLVIIVGEKKAIFAATENKSQRLRYTSLRTRFQDLL